MIKFFYIFIGFFSCTFSCLSAQTALDKALKTMNVQMDIPSFFDVSQNEEPIYITPETKESPIPKIKQQYDFEPSFGDTALKVYLHLGHSIIRHKTEDYLIFVDAIGEVAAKYRGITKNPVLFNSEQNDALKRIKFDFRYGKRMSSPSEGEIEELKLMLTYYPEKQAKEMFNADWMVMYPMNLRGEVLEGKFSRCRAVAVSKYGMDMFFYFMMTDESSKKFDTYLMDLNKVFWFNE